MQNIGAHARFTPSVRRAVKPKRERRGLLLRMRELALEVRVRNGIEGSDFSMRDMWRIYCEEGVNAQRWKEQASGAGEWRS